MKRRQFIKLAGGAGSLTALSGCSGLVHAIPGCGRKEGTNIRFQSVDWSNDSVEDEPSKILPFNYGGLSAAFPEIFDGANEPDWSYEQCPPVPSEVDTFVALTRKRIIRQFDEYEGDPSENKFLLSSAYVKRADTYEKLFLYHRGELISGDTLLNNISTSR